jgi:hypothetical protein
MSKKNRFMGFGFKILLSTALFAMGPQFAVTQELQDATSAPASLQCGQFGVRNAEYFRISSDARSLITADFNNDAIPDVVAMMPGTNSISVSLGDNQTGFGTAHDFVVGVSPQEAVAGDFNRDGELDLAVTSALDDFVTVLHGDGQGNFAVSNSYPVGGGPRGVEAADFNRDGWLDLVTANTEAPTVNLPTLGSFTETVSAGLPKLRLSRSERCIHLLWVISIPTTSRILPSSVSLIQRSAFI